MYTSMDSLGVLELPSEMQHHTHLCETLWEMRKYKEFCDVYFVVGGAPIWAHKVILSTCSPYLRECFNDIQDSGIVLENYSQNVFFEVLQYIYTGKCVGLSGDKYDEFMKLVKEWQINENSKMSRQNLNCVDECAGKDDEIDSMQLVETESIEFSSFDSPGIPDVKQKRVKNEMVDGNNKEKSNYNEDSLEHIQSANHHPAESEAGKASHKITKSAKPRPKKMRTKNTITSDKSVQNIESADENQQELKDMVSAEEGVTQNYCKYCDKNVKFVKFHTWKYHYCAGTPEPKLYYCEYPGCKKVFPRQINLNAHTKNAHSAKKSICSTCGKPFKNEQGMRHHMKVKHCVSTPMKSQVSRFRCTEDGCGKEYKNKAALDRHSKRHQGATLICELCGYSCVEEESMRNHKYKVHTILPPEGKLYKCRYCDHKTCFPSGIKSHEKRHSSEKPFQCDKCPQTFKSNVDLLGHFRRIHEQVKFYCKYCGRSFSAKHDLKIHVLNQHEEKHVKAHACYMCGYRSNLKGNLNIHLRNVHKVEVLTKYKVPELDMDSSSENIESHESTTPSGETEQNTAENCLDISKDSSNVTSRNNLTNLNLEASCNPYSNELCHAQSCNKQDSHSATSLAVEGNTEVLQGRMDRQMEQDTTSFVVKASTNPDTANNFLEQTFSYF